MEDTCHQTKDINRQRSIKKTSVRLCKGTLIPLEGSCQESIKGISPEQCQGDPLVMRTDRNSKRRGGDEGKQMKTKTRAERQRAYYLTHKEVYLTSKRKWYKKNKAKADRKSAQWYHRNKERTRVNQLCWKYSLTKEQYNILHTKQKGRCKICNRKAPLVIDHDHTTGRVRGLLCTYCNTMLGMSKDNPNTLSRASAYLRRTSCLKESK